ncbi:TetR/AcrR family transcriptional regulator [Ralstonia insidiosa]|uniref:TetR family transcriptional regulator n=1 Tax=Ralstonia insidiosa TaxID=190721 RepID=A0A191ZVE2_9RALS|nr:TetR/AcrR family transcriptional regulator [Ralstonia insidiosa]ANJ72053.1 TetR family transcriptional regulator [Ralstonia insidiosa]KAB0472676.1 TetR/AcrR family transcriptional regulator [Ralstonia insidiosa]MBY4907716.1 TetR/AcrR family transcriptional regulator [Ralstonia insidiosa]
MRNLMNRVAEGRHQRRGTRRKEETRTRLLHAALLLLSEKSIERVAISEITEAADVGFGSFYNHFESKEGLFAALIDWAFEDFADRLDGAAHGLTDPAEIIALSVRHTLLRAQREPVWGRLLMREGVSTRALTHSLGLRLLRDSHRGLAAKRFVVADPLPSVLSVIGTVLAGVAAELHFATTAARPGRGRQAAAVRVEHLAERAAVFVLQALGIKRVEAERIAQLPLPMFKDGDAATPA